MDTDVAATIRVELYETFLDDPILEDVYDGVDTRDVEGLVPIACEPLVEPGSGGFRSAVLIDFCYIETVGCGWIRAEDCQSGLG